MAHVVWLKRDLRIDDHRPLVRAAERGPTIVLWVWEPELLAEQTTDPSHVAFVIEALAELEETLRKRGGALTVRVGQMPDVLDRLAKECAGIDALYAHEETGSAISFARDRHVRAWCRDHGVPFHEVPQFGVLRPHPGRDGWAKRWEARMRETLAPAVERISAHPVEPGPRPDLRELGMLPDRRTLRQRGSARAAHALLDSFLAERGVNYRFDMSSPVTAQDGCSRLSPYLAYGAISLRYVYQRTLAREIEVKARLSEGELFDRRWSGSLSSFRGRLHWHCHFMQKLEDQPSLEFENQARAYDGLREAAADSVRFNAWQEGMTGYPMIDACMRALNATGWINFRMRAMLMSFASYHLWLHWRPTGIELARRFLDFEPGIHWPQAQMQSGVTGINSVRIYSPTKQASDHDPDGNFIRRWVPELARIPTPWLAEPHRLPPLDSAALGFRPGVDYPLPIVDHLDAVRDAKARIYTIRRTVEARSESKHVFVKHGSRRPPRNNFRDRNSPPATGE